jgi:hypothetical protein
MIKLLDIENSIEEKLLSFPNTIKNSLSQLEGFKFNLDSNEITESIINRMRVYSDCQTIIKNLLNKRYAAPASDFFVETVAFYVKAYLNSIKSKIEVHSERQIRPKRGAMRPDISLWIEDEVIGIIECKTQLGYNRQNWDNQHKNRKVRLKAEFPKAKAWLVVFSSSNWSGFEENPLVDKEYFTLANIHMSGIKKNEEKNVILNRVENLLKQL